MDKKTLYHSALIVIAVGIYYITSPSYQTAPAAVAVVPPTVSAEMNDEPISTPNPEPATLPSTLPSSLPAPEIIAPPEMFKFIEIINSCDYSYKGDCVNVRSEPSATSTAITKVRTGIVLKVDDKVEAGGREWYKVVFKESLRYPERLTSDWYVAAEFTRPFTNEGIKQIEKDKPATTTKRITVDLSDQKIYAYDGDELFMEQIVSTGIPTTPTPRGVFTIFKKTPTRYMQGPIPGISDHYYDLPGVPWNLYFTSEGAVFHGAYWHDDFGAVHSNGCVNMPLDKAEELYTWADLGTVVTVRD
jgi:lipoprotein-anchoring transpeptidase ErfK/SrfK